MVVFFRFKTGEQKNFVLRFQRFVNFMENLWISEIFVSMKKKNLWAIDLVWTVFAVYVRNDVIVLLLYAIQSIPSDIYLVLNMW